MPQVPAAWATLALPAPDVHVQRRHACQLRLSLPLVVHEEVKHDGLVLMLLATLALYIAVGLLLWSQR
jgi:hypothetical protein